jgi:hypothetical protein
MYFYHRLFFSWQATSGDIFCLRRLRSARRPTGLRSCGFAQSSPIRGAGAQYRAESVPSPQEKIREGRCGDRRAEKTRRAVRFASAVRVSRAIRLRRGVVHRHRRQADWASPLLLVLEGRRREARRAQQGRGHSSILPICGDALVDQARHGNCVRFRVWERGIVGRKEIALPNCTGAWVVTAGGVLLQAVANNCRSNRNSRDDSPLWQVVG